MKFEIGLEKRKFILTISLLVENFTSIFLARLLEIEDYRETISFSNKSSTLSFNQKINLLIDIKAIEGENKNKFQTFMEIRNQFMHNLEADTYEKCFKFLNGRDKFILKVYPENSDLSKEDQLEKATERLFYDVLRMSSKLYEKVREKIEKEVKHEMLQKAQPVLLRVIAELNK